jgi:PTH1 family peptidyl-tRNA hydrolase
LWAVVGLGNPGGKYQKTRHNIGFMVLEQIALTHGFKPTEKKLYISAKGSIGEQDVLLMEPLTFMNLSGVAVREIIRRFRLSPESLVVIHDDLDMATGKLKIKTGGSSGGHRGIESIIQNIGSEDFIRVKIGIGRDEEIPAEKFVLSKFKREEIETVKQAVQDASDAVLCIIQEGVTKAMNQFNKKSEPDN